MQSSAIIYEKFGDPLEVLELRQVDAPSDLQPGQVLLKLVGAPIHPSDVGMISGRYGRLPSLPAIGGREGLGEVIKSTSKNFKEGERVKFPFGSWREFAVADESELFHVPNDIDPLQAAISFINPLTAWMILHRFRELRPGDWVIQNAANSAVGVALIQISKILGVHTINLVRNAESRKGKLLEYGATLVFEDETFDSKTLKDHADGQLPVLGLNSIGGTSALNLVKSLGFGGQLITIGGMVGDKVRFPTRELIFNNVTLRGFWLDKFCNTEPHDTLQSLYNKVFDMIRAGQIVQPIDSIVKLSDGPEAIISAHNNRKNGKVVIIP